MAKDKKIQPLPPPEPQICPKCKKEYHDNKWGGCGICECGYYFHPEWYSKSNGETQDNKKKYAETKEQEEYVPDMVFDDEGEDKLLKEAREKGKIK